MISDFIQTILIILGITIIGSSFVISLIRKRSLNVFLILGLGFIFGNFVLVIVLNFLAMTNLLDFSKLSFYILLISAVLILLKFRSYIRIRLQDMLLLFLLMFFFGILIFPKLLTPIEIWDAIAIWYLKAKWLFLGTGYTSFSFLNNEFFSYAQLEYPNGFPLLLSLFFRFYGVINEQASKIYLMSMMFSLVLLFCGMARHFVRKLSIINLLSIFFSIFVTGELLLHATSGYAEVLLSLSFLGSTILFILAINEFTTRGQLDFHLLSLSFFCSLFSIYIKNEGLTFFIINTGLILFVVIFISYKKIHLQDVLSILKKQLLCAIFFMLSIMGFCGWLIIKGRYHLSNDFSVGSVVHFSLQDIMTKMCTIVYFCLNLINDIQLWGVLFYPCILILVSITLLNLRNKKLISLLLPNFIIILQSLAYLLVYVITPFDLNWHLATSMDRLVLQLLPSILICTFWSVYAVSKYSNDCPTKINI